MQIDSITLDHHKRHRGKYRIRVHNRSIEERASRKQRKDGISKQAIKLDASQAEQLAETHLAAFIIARGHQPPRGAGARR